jgi:hypothetical protein
MMTHRRQSATGQGRPDEQRLIGGIREASQRGDGIADCQRETAYDSDSSRFHLSLFHQAIPFMRVAL